MFVKILYEMHSSLENNTANKENGMNARMSQMYEHSFKLLNAAASEFCQESLCYHSKISTSKWIMEKY